MFMSMLVARFMSTGMKGYEKVGINHVVKDKLYFDFILQHLTCRLNSVIAKKIFQVIPHIDYMRVFLHV